MSLRLLLSACRTRRTRSDVQIRRVFPLSRRNIDGPCVRIIVGIVRVRRYFTLKPSTRQPILTNKRRCIPQLFNDFVNLYMYIRYIFALTAHFGRSDFAESSSFVSRALIILRIEKTFIYMYLYISKCCFYYTG